MTTKIHRIERDDFNRDCEFVVFKPMSQGGKILTRGQPFDKTTVNIRRLRQLFDQYYIIPAGEKPKPVQLKDYQEDVHSQISKESEVEKPKIERVKVERVNRNATGPQDPEEAS